MTNINKKIFHIFVLFSVFFFLIPKSSYATLSCSITTVAGCSGIVVLRMSSSSNAHAELPSQSNPSYSNNVICCSGITGTSCAATTTAVVLKLQKVTNSHVEVASGTNYSNSACISNPYGTITIGYQNNNCNGYDTTLASISNTTNAHIASTSTYTKKVCGSVYVPAISFSISTTTLYFGTLSKLATVYASSTNLSGSPTEVEAHNIVVNTNALNGYVILVQGKTLTSLQNASNTISALLSNTSPSIGTEQFGIRAVASGGGGSVTAPYSASGFAYTGTATSTSQLASNSTGDGIATIYSLRYMANISQLTKTGDYSTSLTYTAIANF